MSPKLTTELFYGENSSQQPRCDDSQPLNDLLPCPFCGKTAIIADMKMGRYHVVCNGCHAQMGTDWDDRWSKQDLVKMWNQRAR